MNSNKDNNFNFLDLNEIDLLKNFNYLIVGLNDIGYTISKNLWVLNVDKITWIDDRIEKDSSGKEKKRSDIIRKKLNLKCDDTEIGTAKLNDIELYIQNNNIIVINELFSLEKIKIWNDIAYEHKNNIVWNLNTYIKGLIITDFNFIRVKKPFNRNIFNKIWNITNEQFGRLTCQNKHDLENNDFISISEVEGMDDVNGNESRPVKVLNKKEILIENTSKYNNYIKSGKIIKNNVPHNLYYKRIYNIIENDLLKNTYLIVKYGQDTSNLLFLFFIIIKEDKFVNDLKNNLIKDNELEDTIKNILNSDDNINKIKNIPNLEILYVILITMFKNKPEKDFLFNSIIGNLSFHEIIKISGKFKPIPGFLIIDFLTYFPDINDNIEKHIIKFFDDKLFKILIVGYNKNTEKLIKLISNIKSLNSKNLFIYIYDTSQKYKGNEIKKINNLQVYFINNIIKEDNKLGDYNLVFCVIYDNFIIKKLFNKLNSIKRYLYTIINFNFEIKLIYKEEDYIKYNLIKDDIITSKDLILLSKQENNLSLNIINYSNQVYKIIFEDHINIFKDSINKEDFNNIIHYNKKGLLLVLVYLKLKIIEIIFKKPVGLIDELLDLSYILIYKIIISNFDEKTTDNFIKKHIIIIKKFMKKFLKLVIKLINMDYSSLKLEINKKIKIFKILNKISIMKIFPIEVKYNIVNLFTDVLNLIKLNTNHRISLTNRIHDDYEIYILNLVYVLSQILSEIYPTQIQIQKKDIIYYIGIFKNNLKSCSNFENFLIIIKIIKNVLNKNKCNDLIINFENNEYIF